MKTVPTWATLGVEEMGRGIALMRQGIPYFAWQTPDGSYHPCHHIDQLKRFEAGIFDGERACGFYAIRPDNRTRWGAADFDNHDGSKSQNYWLPDVQRTFDRLASQLAERWCVESSKGSYHVIGFADKLMPAADMRAILLATAPAGVEVFPKQDTLDNTKPNAKGSLLRFPGRHQLKGTWACFLNRAGRIESTEMPGPERMTAFSEPDEQMRFLALYHNVTRDMTLTANGQRYRAMQRIVGRLKGRTLDEDVAAQVHDRFWNANRQYIGTAIAKSRRQFLAFFHKAAPCIIALPDYEPTAHQLQMIETMPDVQCVRRDRLETAVRLFLSAQRHAEVQGRECFLSLRTLADRLQVGIAAASKYRDACYRVGLIEMLQRGSQATGLASTYTIKTEWLK